MKVKRVSTWITFNGTQNAIFTEIETADGIIGQSETSMKRRPKTVQAYIDEIGKTIIGLDPRRIEDIVEKLYRDSFWIGGILHSSGIGAIEVALWDILGKELQAPIHRLLGGPTRNDVPVYCHCKAGNTPEEFVNNLHGCINRGYTVIKTALPVFYGGTEQGGGKTGEYSGTPGVIPRSQKETEHLPQTVIKRIASYFEAARREIGWEVELAVDCRARLSPASAIRLCSALEEYDLMFVEEPIPPEDPRLLRDVKESTTVPIAAGEKWAMIYGAKPFIEMDSVSIAQPDVAKCGGFAHARRIAGMAEAHSITVAVHNTHGPVGTAASLQFAASIPNLLILETLGPFDDWQEMANDAPTVENGRMRIPTKPGLGVTLDTTWLKNRPYQDVRGWR